MKKTVREILSMKGKEKICMLTAYDAPTAKLLSDAGIEIILVGDSVANTLLGYESTKEISMNEMLHHTAAVARAKPEALIVADMPINSYENKKIALRNAQRFLSAGADAVKIEGAKIEVVKALRLKRIQVMGHLGLLPQSAKKFSVKGKNFEEAKRILDDAILLERAGCFSIVLECIPAALASKITKSVSIPTIGIGAGPLCDGQVLVINDLLGFNADENFKPKFVKRYANLNQEILRAVKEFRREVKERKFPSKELCYP
ncbi:MAG: 3-methyl-2-oxobutanoate hydroxymethyltransferase [Candidatus Diapherotrites archaeon]